jgi:predicted O-linked N-acetylglucosamine transferase (SPINDLY family)
MYNEPRHMVSVFKDFLIYDDFSEYLKRMYSKGEAVERLPRVFEFYTSFSRVGPTFVAMGEAECKYMFKNIERKQKLIDEKNRTKEKIPNGQIMFSSGFMRELNQQSHQNSATLKQADSFIINAASSIQYIPTSTRVKNSHNLESIINMMSRYIEESITLNSRIETTQFSDLTQ